jgi:uncharacterized membrane protein YqaE (UPF0057 family)
MVSQWGGGVNRLPQPLLLPEGVNSFCFKKTPMEILKIVVAIFLRPVAAFLQVGLSLHLFINILLTLLGGIPGIVCALWLIIKNK